MRYAIAFALVMLSLEYLLMWRLAKAEARKLEATKHNSHPNAVLPDGRPVPEPNETKPFRKGL